MIICVLHSRCKVGVATQVSLIFMKGEELVWTGLAILY